jgi:hypothetical protein
MLNNISNFFNLVKGKRVKKTLAPNDMIAIGVRDTANRADYQPAGIFFKDLKDQLGVTLTTSGTGGASSYIGGTLNIPIYQTQISHLKWNDTEKTIWNNGLGSNISNTGFGNGVLKSRTSGSNNTGFGYLTLWDTTTGNSNTGFGTSALRSNSTGSSNTAFGTSALLSNTTGSRNTAIGNTAMFSGNSTAENTAIGHSSLQLINSASSNTAVGSGSLSLNTFGGANTGIGRNVLSNNTSGGSNTAIGESALSQNTIGNNNVAVGQFGLNGNSLGSNNTAIGWATTCANYSGCVLLGREATATANNQFVVGSAFTNAGAITTETITPNTTWTVRINGANYKIPLLAI